MTEADFLTELRQCHVELEEAAKLLNRTFPRIATVYLAAAQRVAAFISKAGETREKQS